METVREVVKASASRITTNVNVDQVRATVATVSSHLTWINEIAGEVKSNE